MNGFIDFFREQVPVDDMLALVFFTVSWFVYTSISERVGSNKKEGVPGIMQVHRHNWMRMMLRRESRLPDVNAVGNLMRSIAFFASTSVLIIVGLVGMLGKQDAVKGLISSLPFSTTASPFMWEMKFCLLILLFIYAFFKFTWSLRQYNYLNVIIVAAPPASDLDEEEAEKFAAGASKVSINAARHFGFGLRAYYFAMPALTWFIGSIMFMVTTAWVMWILYRREFRSKTLDNLKIVGNTAF